MQNVKYFYVYVFRTYKKELINGKGVAFHTPKKRKERDIEINMRIYLNFQLEYLAKRGREKDLEFYRIFTSSITKQDAGSRECKSNPFFLFPILCVIYSQQTYMTLSHFHFSFGCWFFALVHTHGDS
jgi:hypothetical protein